MSKYLDSNGLLYFWSKIKAWVEAKGYTTNTGTITSVKTTAGKHTTINVTNGAAEMNIPTNTSHLTNDAGFITLSQVPEGAAASSTTPLMDGVASAGSETAFARGDHKHPSDSSKQDVISDLATIRSGAQAGATAYQKPSGGVPLSDLSTAVQTSLDKADSAMQQSDLPVATTTTPKANGTAAVGTETKWAKGDHVHPTDTTRAPLASPALTGIPTAPTATAGTNNTQIATTAFVTSAIATAQTGAAMFQGAITSATAITGLSDYKKGWYWVVKTAGTYVGQACEVGDMIYCIADFDSAYQASDFSVIQTNLDIQSITNAEIDAIAV